MSLTAAMLIGRSALTASQLGIQVSGNNIANVGTPGYSRQIAYFDPVGSDTSTISGRSGRGVNVRDVRRQIDSVTMSVTSPVAMTVPFSNPVPLPVMSPALFPVLLMTSVMTKPSTRRVETARRRTRRPSPVRSIPQTVGEHSLV